LVVIAADSGFDHALSLGLQVDLLIGDLDSISADGLDAAVDANIRIERHPSNKDNTDTELAIAAAVAGGCSEIIGLTGGGGRLDHELTTLLAFASCRSCAVTVWSDSTLVIVIHGPASTTTAGTPGALLSLIPVHGDALGVTTDGLRYPLAAELLAAGSARGTSNEFIGTEATISLTSGTLLVIVPDALDVVLESATRTRQSIRSQS
jgi:thiamine pyrophosphokinase